MMRWLFIVVLALLIACVLSLVWMKDRSRWPLGDSRSHGVQQQPDDQGGLLPVPPPHQ